MGKEVLKQFKQKLSILLVAAMLVGMMQPTVLDVQAAAPEDGIEAVTGEAVDEQVIDNVSDETADEQVIEDASDVDAIESTVEEELPLFDNTGAEVPMDNEETPATVSDNAVEITFNVSMNGISKAKYTASVSGDEVQDGAKWADIADKVSVSGNAIAIMVTVADGFKGKYHVGDNGEEEDIISGKAIIIPVSGENVKIFISAVAEEIPPSAENHKVTIKNENADLVTDVKYSEDGKTWKDFSGEISISENSIQLKFDLAENCTATVSANGQEVKANDSVYTIEISKDTEIVISAQEKTTKVFFEYDVTAIEVTSVSVNDQAAELTEEWTETNTLSVKPGQKVAFSVGTIGEFASKLTVTEVKNDEGKLSVSDNRYTLAVSDNDIKISLKAEIKKETANTVKVNTASDMYTVKAGLNDTYDVQTEDTIYTVQDALDLNIKAKEDGYIIRSVKVIGNKAVSGNSVSGDSVSENTTEIEATGGVYDFKINFKDYVGAVRVEVEATEAASDKDINVVFANSARNMTFGINAKNFKKVEVGANTYTVAKEKESLVFTVKQTNANYKPIVTVGKSDKNYIDNLTPKKNVYTITVPFRVLAAQLNENGEVIIHIGEEIATKDVSVSYNSAEVEMVSARVGAQAVAVSDNNVFEDVNVGDTLKITFKAKDHCKLTSYALGTAAKKNISAKEGTAGKEFVVSLKVSAEPTANVVKIESDALYWAQWGRSEDGFVTVSNGKTYNAYPVGEAYEVEYFKGAGIPVSQKKITIASDKGNTGATLSENNTIWFTEEAAGKQFTVTATDGDDSTGKISFKVKVSPVLTNIKLTGTGINTKKNVASATYDTSHSWNIAGDKGANLAGLKVVYDEKSSIKLSVASPDGSNSELTVEVPSKASLSVNTLEVRFVRETSKGDVPINVNGKDSFAIDLTNANPVKGKTPTVSVRSKDDVSLDLSLSTKEINTRYIHNLYYAINVSKETKKSAADASVGTIYVKPSEYSSDARADVHLQVSDREFGSGLGGNFQINVALVQLPEKPQLYEGKWDAVLGQYTYAAVSENSLSANDGTNVNTKGDLKSFLNDKVASNIKTISAATLAARYETNLKLTKGTTTLYTGSRYVRVATVKFSSNTTHKNIANVEDITYSGDEALNSVYFSKDDNGIVINQIDKKVALGKHTIEVTAEAGTNTAPSTAKIDVTVVQGIEGIKVAVPSEKIYKTDGKAATLKPSVTYEPANSKTKKVTWKIVDKDEKICEYSKSGKYEYYYFEDGFDKKLETAIRNKLLTVNANNGTVTVNRNFVVPVDNLQFKLKAVVAETYGSTDTWSNNDHYKITKVTPLITIVSQSEAAGIAAIVKAANEGDGYDVVAITGGTVKAEELQGAQVVLLKKGVAENKKTVTEDDLLPVTNYTVTSKSAKNLAVTKDNGAWNLKVVKPGKNLTLNVATSDGSKQSVSLKLTVNYDVDVTADNFALYIANMETNETVSSNEISFAGTKANAFTARVYEKTSEGWQELSKERFADYTIEIKNATKITEGVGWVEFVSNKKEATLNLKVGKKVIATYTITNTAFSGLNKAPKLSKIENLGDTNFTGLDKKLKNQDIRITFKDENLHGKVVKTELDWQAKNYSAYEALYENTNKVFSTVSSNTTVSGNSYTLSFKNITPENIPAGSYKLKITLGDFTNGKFVPSHEPMALTLKVGVATPTKASYSVTKSYTMKLSERAITLKGSTPKNVPFTSVTYSIQNAYGSNGQPNRFLDFFELTGEDKDTKLVLKENVDYDTIIKEFKNASTGYVTYTAQVGDNGYGEPIRVTGTVKISLKLTDDIKKVNTALGKAEKALQDLEVEANAVSGNAAYNVSANDLAVQQIVSAAGTAAGSGFTVKTAVQGDKIYGADTTVYTTLTQKEAPAPGKQGVAAITLVVSQLSKGKEVAKLAKTVEIKIKAEKAQMSLEEAKDAIQAVLSEKSVSVNSVSGNTLSGNDAWSEEAHTKTLGDIKAWAEDAVKNEGITVSLSGNSSLSMNSVPTDTATGTATVDLVLARGEEAKTYTFSIQIKKLGEVSEPVKSDEELLSEAAKAVSEAVKDWTVSANSVSGNAVSGNNVSGNSVWDADANVAEEAKLLQAIKAATGEDINVAVVVENDKNTATEIEGDFYSVLTAITPATTAQNGSAKISFKLSKGAAEKFLTITVAVVTEKATE